LIELIAKADEECKHSKSCKACSGYGKGSMCMNYHIADHLLENGVVVPPCKVGDTVWAIYDKKIYEAIAEQVTVVSHISGNKIIKIKAEFDIEDWFYNDGRKTKYGIYGYYQENVFLTKEEAEQALKGGDKE
jgi:hypothetical protein